MTVQLYNDYREIIFNFFNLVKVKLYKLLSY